MSFQRFFIDFCFSGRTVVIVNSVSVVPAKNYYSITALSFAGASGLHLFLSLVLTISFINFLAGSDYLHTCCTWISASLPLISVY